MHPFGPLDSPSLQSLGAPVGNAPLVILALLALVGYVMTLGTSLLAGLTEYMVMLVMGLSWGSKNDIGTFKIFDCSQYNYSTKQIRVIIRPARKHEVMVVSPTRSCKVVVIGHIHG